jgi:hypothetical protein
VVNGDKGKDRNRDLKVSDTRARLLIAEEVTELDVLQKQSQPDRAE